MSVHCLESGGIGKYTPLGPRDFPRAGILHPSALEIALGQSLGPRGAKSPPLGNLLGLGGCIFRYIPPLGSVRIQYFFSSSDVDVGIFVCYQVDLRTITLGVPPQEVRHMIVSRLEEVGEKQ